MYPTPIDVDAVAHREGFLLRLGVFGICDGQLPSQNEMCGQAIVRMWAIMGVAMWDDVLSALRELMTCIMNK